MVGFSCVWRSQDAQVFGDAQRRYRLTRFAQLSIGCHQSAGADQPFPAPITILVLCATVTEGLGVSLTISHLPMPSARGIYLHSIAAGGQNLIR
jgi:hypothetical protein